MENKQRNQNNGGNVIFVANKHLNKWNDCYSFLKTDSLKSTSMWRNLLSVSTVWLLLLSWIKLTGSLCLCFAPLVSLKEAIKMKEKTSFPWKLDYRVGSYGVTQAYLSKSLNRCYTSHCWRSKIPERDEECYPHGCLLLRERKNKTVEVRSEFTHQFCHWLFNLGSYHCPWPCRRMICSA